MVCGADLWDVERGAAGRAYVSAGCVGAMKEALDRTDDIGEIQVVPLPVPAGPRMGVRSLESGGVRPLLRARPRPGGGGGGGVGTASPLDSDDYLEDAEEVGGLLRRAV